ncbi:hypothetical protein [Sphaerotilus sp.]|uniref:hypothetical protein n=1 Tax=Sphaerotilus sp. TaxID=2093942 RepID=UPI002ACE65A8|nr:hypothetical protein [Sphaerotilus sp.]MDZ7858995.1 hypothetical protein [Sphaerotilus sp.]
MTSRDSSAIPALQNLERIRKLDAEPPDGRELRGLLHSARVRLKDSHVASLSIESRFDLAYNAAHATALAAMRAQGYRSENRYLVFQCLEHTAGWTAQQWQILNLAHGKRNLAEYEGDLDVTEAFVQALITCTEALLARVTALVADLGIA